ncbi:MAG: hypothetical protein FJ090_01735 [Deltaproteobacteria bacterium]|nr:hypothetical protein [Deltaproteobacteria bacterium]
MRKLRLVIAASLFVTLAYAATGREEAVPDRLLHQANGVAQWLDGGVEKSQFSTGVDIFNREWAYGMAQMAAFGLGQRPALDEDLRRNCTSRSL